MLGDLVTSYEKQIKAACTENLNLWRRPMRQWTCLSPEREVVSNSTGVQITHDGLREKAECDMPVRNSLALKHAAFLATCKIPAALFLTFK